MTSSQSRFARSAAIPVICHFLPYPVSRILTGVAGHEILDPTLEAERARSRLGLAVRPLAHRDFRLLAIGSGSAFTGYWMFYVAQGWLALELTNSAAWVGLLSTSGLIPFF